MITSTWRFDVSLCKWRSQTGFFLFFGQWSHYDLGIQTFCDTYLTSFFGGTLCPMREYLKRLNIVINLAIFCTNRKTRKWVLYLLLSFWHQDHHVKPKSNLVPLYKTWFSSRVSKRESAVQTLRSWIQPFSKKMQRPSIKLQKNWFGSLYKSTGWQQNRWKSFLSCRWLVRFAYMFFWWTNWLNHQFNPIGQTGNGSISFYWHQNQLFWQPTGPLKATLRQSPIVMN